MAIYELVLASWQASLNRQSKNRTSVGVRTRAIRLVGGRTLQRSGVTDALGVLVLSWVWLIAYAAPVSGQSTDDPCMVAHMDSDGDGLTDTCEAWLAQQFAPVFVASSRACNWDAELQRLEGGYLVGVGPADEGGGVVVAYLPAYRTDCGWSGVKCALRPLGGCDGHVGDSEFVAVVSERAGDGSWQPVRVFLSAHCFGASDGRCRWYDPDDLAWEGTSPVVWVAEGKNANYPSRRTCDSGHWFFDTCEANDVRFRFPVIEGSQNIGSATRPFPALDQTDGCVRGGQLLQPIDPPGVRECVWSSEAFRGWTGEEGIDGSTSYVRYLRTIGGFFEVPEPSTAAPDLRGNPGEGPIGRE